MHRKSTEQDQKLPGNIGAMLKQIQQEEVIRRQRFGDVRPMVHIDWQAKKFVAVGDQMHWSDKWKTPIDFFSHYLRHVFTIEWMKNEHKKAYSQRHPVLQWCEQIGRLQDTLSPDSNGIYELAPSGAMRAYILLAYDLYTLRHHDALQQAIVERMKYKEQFQGARHELFAAATCVRAGFQIDYENEKDRSRRHPEFTGTHKYTGQKITVEAKSKHRRGVLGHPGDRSPVEKVCVRIGRLFNDAINKPAPSPYIIFMDLNMPPNSLPPMTQKWLEIVVGPLLTDQGKSRSSDPWNLVVFSNFPDHYPDDDKPAPTGYVVALLGRNPKIVPSHPETIISVFDAAQMHGNIPNRFEDLE